MSAIIDSKDGYRLLEARLKTLLPEEYQDTYEDVQPVSMGSAGLQYDAGGRVAWDKIWGSFCDLAMAGGPPHRGTLLEPARGKEIRLHPERYETVVDELCRGVELVTGLAAEPSSMPGWIQVDCPSTGMAGWLVRAITMENVSAYSNGMALYLPAGPHFRLEKEIKNVITSIAKTCHYWLGHTSVEQHRAIAELLRVMEGESPLLRAPFPSREPITAGMALLQERVAAEVLSRTGLIGSGRAYHGWLGIDCREVRSAIWMMRLLVASNVLARREGNLLYVPLHPSADRNGAKAVELVARAYRLARARGVL